MLAAAWRQGRTFLFRQTFVTPFAAWKSGPIGNPPFTLRRPYEIGANRLLSQSEGELHMSTLDRASQTICEQSSPGIAYYSPLSTYLPSAEAVPFIECDQEGQ